jgi:hypothetical protein
MCRGEGPLTTKADAASWRLDFPVYFIKRLIQFVRVECVNLFRECNQTGNMPPHTNYG